MCHGYRIKRVGQCAIDGDQTENQIGRLRAQYQDQQSGNGREGSKYGLDDYTELKYVCIGEI